MSQRAGEAIPHQPGMIQDLLKGSCGRALLSFSPLRVIRRAEFRSPGEQSSVIVPGIHPEIGQTTQYKRVSRAESSAGGGKSRRYRLKISYSITSELSLMRNPHWMIEMD